MFLGKCLQYFSASNLPRMAPPKRNESATRLTSRITALSSKWLEASSKSLNTAAKELQN